MLREFVEALTVITQETVVVLALEDLQWSDTATVEALSYLARRPESLRLLVLGTYRPAELIAHEHPLRQTVQELLAHQLCQELPLELLTEEQVQAYVAQRLGARPASPELGTMLYRRTEGNALFTVHLLNHLLQQGSFIDTDGQWRLRDDINAVNREVPEGLRALLLKQVENLGADIVNGKYGIREPGDRCVLVPLNRLDLVLVPGVAFDVRGRRIGRGKGYYDRLLSLAGGLKCGVAFDEQILAEIPTEPHDVAVHCILTPTRWILP